MPERWRSRSSIVALGSIDADGTSDAAVVPSGVEFVEAERGHHLDLILRHRAKRIILVVLAAWRLLGIAVAAQIRAHHGEFFRQCRCDLQPRQMRERVAVHQQHRWSLAAVDGHDARAAGLDLGAGEAFHHDDVSL